jgi:hypothetical protein
MEHIQKMTRMPTSDKYILSKIKTNIIANSDLELVDDIDELFENDSFIVLYENTAGDVGHWVAVVRRGDTLSYFDSYGRKPDFPKYIGNKYPHLSRLLYNSRYNLEYNEKNLQEKNRATCGHHAIVRILFKNEPLADYHKFMEKFDNDDEIVTAISNYLL